MTETERAKQLANDHWSYIESLLVTHHVGDGTLHLIKFHYKSAMIHGHRHGTEDERGGMFRPSIGEPLTAAEVNAISRPCSACLDEKKCGGGLRLINGDCLHHRPRFIPGIPDQQHPRKEG